MTDLETCKNMLDSEKIEHDIELDDEFMYIQIETSTRTIDMTFDLRTGKLHSLTA